MWGWGAHMAPQIRKHRYSFAEKIGSVLSPRVGSDNYNSGSRASDALFRPPRVPPHVHVNNKTLNKRSFSSLNWETYWASGFNSKSRTLWRCFRVFWLSAPVCALLNLPLVFLSVPCLLTAQPLFLRRLEEEQPPSFRRSSLWSLLKGLLSLRKETRR